MSGERRGWGWVAALRDGSTSSWAEWTGEADPTGDDLPGAQQLALLHRLNTFAAAAGRTVPAATADRILAATVSGRGRGDLPLVGTSDSEHPFGLRPADPDTLAAGEMLRVAAGLIADDIAAAVPATPLIEPRGMADRLRAVRRLWSPAFVIVGVPWRAEAIRAGLAAQGLGPGGRNPTAYLIADRLDRVLADAFIVRSFDRGGGPWVRFLESFSATGRVPPRADLARMARAASYKYGAERVRVVTDTAQLAAELGVRSLSEPPRLDAPAVDLIRRVGEPLGLLVPAEHRPLLLRRLLLPRVSGPTGRGLEVSARWRPWLRAEAERACHDLAASGYPVLGDLDDLLPGPVPSDHDRRLDAEVLPLALDLLLDPVRAR